MISLDSGKGIAVAKEFIIKNGVVIPSLAGNADHILIVDEFGKVQVSDSTVADLSGSGMTPSTSGQFYSGIQDIPVDSNLITIEHSHIEVNESFPVVSLVIPTSASQLLVNGITNRTEDSFDVVLSGTPDASGHQITWHLGQSGAGGQTPSISANVPPESMVLDQVMTYDISGNLETITTSEGVRTFVYDVSGNLTNINATGNYSSKIIHYDPDGNVSSIDVV